jgi:hypothetical protein
VRLNGCLPGSVAVFLFRAKLLGWLVPSAMGPFALLLKLWIPLGALLSYIVTLTSVLVLILPSFFTLLIVRTTKTEIESKVRPGATLRHNRGKGAD